MGRLHVSSGFSLVGCSDSPAHKSVTGQFGAPGLNKRYFICVKMNTELSNKIPKPHK